MRTAFARLAPVIGVALVARWAIKAVNRNMEQQTSEVARLLAAESPQAGEQSAHSSYAIGEGTVRPRSPRRISPNAVILIFISAAALVSGISGWILYSTSRSYITHVPTPPTPHASLDIFFGAPNQRVTIIYHVLPSGRFSIYAESDSPTRIPGQFLAINSSDFGSMVNSYDETGSRDKIQAVYSPSGSLTAKLRNGSLQPSPNFLDSTFFVNGYQDPSIDPSSTAQTATGILVPAGSDSSEYSGVSGRFPPIVTVSPAAEAGQLPMLTSPNLIQEYSSAYRGYESHPIGSIKVRGQRWYPAASAVIRTIVDYNAVSSDEIPGGISLPGTSFNVPLPVKYSIIRTAPDTTDNSELSWTQTGTSQVQWLINNQDGLEASSFDLFIAGILGGAAFGFIVVVVERILSLKFKEK